MAGAVAEWSAQVHPELKELVVEASRALARLDADGWRSWHCPAGL